MQTFSAMQILSFSTTSSETFSERRILKLFQRCVFWNFRASFIDDDRFLIYWKVNVIVIVNKLFQRVDFQSFFSDVLSETFDQWRKLSHASMRKLQKRTNRSSIMRQVLTRNKIDLCDENIDIFKASMLRFVDAKKRFFMKWYIDMTTDI